MPSMATSLVFGTPSIRGMEESRPLVYACWGFAKSSLVELFDNSSCVHHADFVTCLCDYPKVMSDKQNRRPKFYLQAVQQFKNLCLYCYIQGGVGSSAIISWVGQSHCNDHPLPHSSRQLVRILKNASLRKESRPYPASRLSFPSFLTVQF